MTKYILIGGYQEKSDKEALGKAIFSDSQKQINFLICLFARNKFISDLDKIFADNKVFFSDLYSNKEIKFVLADEINFTKQVKEADIIYFSGGDSIPLYSSLARIGNEWTGYLNEKTVIGSSASTDMLSAYCYDIQQDQIGRGLGLVPVKTIVHFESKDYTPSIGWEKAKEILESYKDNLPMYLLKEGDFSEIIV